MEVLVPDSCSGLHALVSAENVYIFGLEDFRIKFTEMMETAIKFNTNIQKVPLALTGPLTFDDVIHCHVKSWLNKYVYRL